MFPDMGLGGLMQQMSGGGPQQSGLPDWMQGGFLANLLGGLKGGPGAPSAGVPGDPMAIGPELPGAAPMPGSPAAGGDMNAAMGSVGKNMMGLGQSVQKAGTPAQPDMKPNPGTPPPASAGQMAGSGVGGLMQMLQGQQGEFPLLPQSSLSSVLGRQPGY